MLANDSLLFIDSNKYLDLYRMGKKGKKLLKQLEQQVDHIFVTQQVVREVQRNKIRVAADFLQQQCKELKIQTFGLPDHLSNTYTDQRKNISEQMTDLTTKIRGVNAEVDAWGLNIMEQISHSEDEVSKALSAIFANAVCHSSEELQRAKERKEFGNPPGKGANPIGDQLNWEQILTHFNGKKRLWIISRDSDYGTTYAGKGFLNGFLYDELCTIASEPEVYLFEDLVNGIEDFVDKTGVEAEQRLAPEEAEEIERVEKSLPPNDTLRTILDINRQLNQHSEIYPDILDQLNQLNRRSKIYPYDLDQLNQLNRRSKIYPYDLDQLNQ
jgi:hypothetical protein